MEESGRTDGRTLTDCSHASKLLGREDCCLQFLFRFRLFHGSLASLGQIAAADAVSGGVAKVAAAAISGVSLVVAAAAAEKCLSSDEKADCASSHCSKGGTASLASTWD